MTGWGKCVYVLIGENEILLIERNHFGDITEMAVIGSGAKHPLSTIRELGGTMPENLSVAESIKKVESRKTREIKAK